MVLCNHCSISKDWFLAGKTSRVMVVWLRSPESLGHRGCADPDEVLLFHPHKETPPEFASMSEIARAMGAHANCAAEHIVEP